jgi:hypothetical protein
VEGETGGDPEVQYGMSLAWNDRQYWPPALQQRTAGFNIEKIWEFIGKAVVSCRKKHYSGEAWAEIAGLTREASELASAAWVELFLEAGDALGEDATGERAQALAARWSELDADSERTKALFARWKELARRPAGVDDAIERQIAMFNLEKVLAFIGKASYCRFQNYDSLYHDAEASLGEDPAGEKAQALAARWAELSAAGPGWPAMLRNHIAFEKVVNFIEKAIAVRKT